MTEVIRTVRRRRLMLALGTSALACGIASNAQAQCAPDPTVTNGTTTCAGTDANGLRVTTSNTTVNVATGATVTNIGAPAIAVDVPRPSYTTINDTLNVLGSVSAAGQNAITATSGTRTDTFSGYSSQQIKLVVGAGGSVSGATALALLQSAGNANGTVTATVDNAGTLTGTSGTALRGNVTTTNFGSTSAITIFDTITNRAGASIVGGILGPIFTLTNAGSIDGGSGSAIDPSAGYAPTVTNAAGGTIRSSSTAATIVAGPAYALTLTNAGTIANAGSGTALSGGTLYVTNQTGGRISSAGATAIGAPTLTLTNAGTVTGNVTTGSGASTVDSTAGTINGALSFGSGNDTLVARYVGSRTLATGVTGAVDGGGGTNTERVVFATDTNVTTPIDLNAGFQRLVLAPAAKVTATLQPGFTTETGLVLSGAGAIVNRATLTVPGTITDLDYAFGSSASFRNEGAINATSGGQAGISFSNHSLTNTGTITVTGGTGISMSYNPVINSGSITASGTAVNIFDGILTNTGSIVSTGGIGLTTFGNVGYTGSNSGTIRGATAGISTDYYFTNTGTISSAQTAAIIQPYGYLINAAGGILNGGTGGAATVNSFNAGIANAGTINGNVTYRSGDNSLTYIALPGGTLNGNLALDGGTLVTNLVNIGPGQFAGITGTVTAASGAKLRYAVNADTSATLPAGSIGPFATAGYQIASGAKLTLAGSAQPSTQTLLLAGSGTVDISASITTTGAAAIQSTSIVTYPGAPKTTSGLAITSRGALSVTSTRNAPVSGAVVLSTGDSFSNAGTITVTDQPNFGAAGVYSTGTGSVTNAGTIIVNGGFGVRGVQSIVNTGTIRQSVGGATAQGVTGFTTLDNQGTISVAGTAALASANDTMLTNSGTLASTTGAAITGAPYSYGTIQIVNKAGGTISGIGRSIQLVQASLSNTGTITGTVDLGYASATSRSFLGSAYVANGGTVTGDVLFGDSNDLFLTTGQALGVSGVIDGGGGRDIFGRALTGTSSAAIDPTNLRNFEDALIQATTVDTVATATATGTFSGNLYAVGPGSVVNQAALAGSLLAGAPSQLALVTRDSTALSALTNAASVAGGVSGSVPVFVNTGAIGSMTLRAPAVSLSSAGALDFTNNGLIQSMAMDTFQRTVQLYGAGTVNVTNAGQVVGVGLMTSAYGDASNTTALTFINSGGITSTNRNAVSLTMSTFYETAAQSLTATNTGTISARDASFARGLSVSLTTAGLPVAYAITNSGIIGAIAQNTSNATTSATGLSMFSSPYFYVGVPVVATTAQGTIVNAAGGVITATADYARGISTFGHALNLVNAGTISAFGRLSSIAVNAADIYAGTVRNTGTIIGDVRLGDGGATVDNAGTITGNVTLGAGDDVFTQRVGGTVSGLIDGAGGTNAYRVDTTGGTTALSAATITNFASVTQTGTGTGSYAGNFGVGTITLAGGTLAVAAGQTLATTGATSITGIAGSGNLAVVNAGTIAGGITLADGDDTVVNSGTIGGPVQLGAGNDTYVEGVGSVAQRGVDGGGGTNLYRVALAGARTGIGARTNFQNLAVDGSGALGLTLDQSFQTIALNGPSLSLTTAGYSVGQIVATGGATQLAFDGKIGAVQLGAGNDTLTLMSGAQVTGMLDGGAGTDTLVLGGSGTLGAAQVVNFEIGTKQGSGTWTLTGTTAASPTSWSVAAGTLSVAGGNAIADGASVAVAGGAALNLQANETIDALTGAGAVTLGANTLTVGAANGNGTFGGTITGTGGLTKAGTGRETLSGVNGYTGATTIAAGTLAMGVANAIGSGSTVAVAGGATFDLAGYSQTVASLTGAGAVTLGAGTLTVGGNNADAGFAGTITGTGGLTKTGTGTLNLTGASSYTGTTTINAGRLAVNGTLAAPVVVNSGGILGGIGTVGAVTVASGGIFAPGNSIGTTSVAGNVTFAAGSIYQVEANAGGMADRINAGGVATLNGGTVQVLAAPGNYNPLTTYTILTAAGGVTGRFAAVTSNLAFLTPYLSYGASAVSLQLGRNDISFASQATSPNGVAVANAIAARGLGDPIYNAILVQTAFGAGSAFNQLSGEIHATVPMVMIDSDRRVRDAILDRTRTVQGDGLGVWLQSMDTRAHSRNQGGRANFHTDRMGVYGGVDYAIAGVRIGLNGGYFNDRLRDPTIISRAQIDTALIGGSIGYAALDGRLSLGGGVTHGWHHVGTTRTVETTGLAGTYLSRSTVRTTQVFGEAAYQILTGPIALTPFVTIVRDWSRANGFTETGGPAALGVARASRHVTTGSAGARLAASYPLAATGWQLEPHVSLGYLRNWGRLGVDRVETFGGSGPAFTVTSDRLGRDNLDANGGLDLLVDARIRVGINGYTTRSSQWRDYGGKAAVSVRF